MAQGEFIALFTITGMPESAGLRIKSTHPVGLYVSSKDPDAAKFWFARKIGEYLLARGLIKPERGGGFGPQDVDWDNALKNGTGQITITLASAAEARMVMKEGEREIIPATAPLETERWKSPTRTPFWFVRDPGDQYDGWLIKTVQEDVAQNLL